MEDTIRAYADASNRGDTKRVISCFVPEAVHYFPSAMYGGPFRGAAQIAEEWRKMRDELDSYWSVDQIITDPETNRAVSEWTHFKRRNGVILRGTEWILFDLATGLIKEVRAYYASPQDPSKLTLELSGFDYRGRGYVVAPPSAIRP